MDNLCHTLVGAAIGEAGLRTRTRFGAAALMISANIPDLDVLSFLTDTSPVAFRRGWTHGILAQIALPVLMTETSPRRLRECELAVRRTIDWTMPVGPYRRQ